MNYNNAERYLQGFYHAPFLRSHFISRSFWSETPPSDSVSSTVTYRDPANQQAWRWGCLCACVCVPACLGTRACARAIARLEHRSLSNREPRRCHTRHLVRQQRVWRTRASYLQAPHTVVHPDAHCGCLLPAVGQPQLSNVDSNSGCVLEMEGEGAAQTAGEQQCQQQVQKAQGPHKTAGHRLKL